MTPSDVKIVAENIDDFIEVPNGIEQLRKAILALAVSGGLLLQDNKDGTSEDLYKKIYAQRMQKAAGRGKKVVDAIPISPEEIPFEIPKSWKWTRLGEIGQIVGGGTPSTIKSGYFVEPTKPKSIPWLSPADMRHQESMYISHGRQNLTEEGYKNSSATLMPPGSVIFSSRAPIGYVGIAINSLSTNQGFKSIVPENGICPEYVYWYLCSRADDINARAPGTTFKEISGTSFSKEVISLPPFAEQKRIVEKVGEVIKQLDVLETKKCARDKVRSRLADSAMQSLGKGESKIAFEQLAELIKTSGDLKGFKSAILTLGISGKLVEQEVNDGTTEDLYVKIKEVRKKRFGERTKMVDDFIPITTAKTPFEIPRTWKWVRLGDVATYIQRGKGPDYVEKSKYPVISQRCVRWNQLDWNPIKFINPESIESYDAVRFLRDGDVLINSTGTGTIGRACLFISNPLYSKVVADSHVTVVRSEVLLPEYLIYWIATDFVQSTLEGDKALGSTNQIEWNLTKLKNEIVPLPPLGEQLRIVDKIKEIMPLLDKLKELIESSN
jgi:type I restriction enzyme S subunit